MFQKFIVRIVRHSAAFMDVRDHNAGIDGIDANAFGRKVQGGTSCQLVDGCFRNAICKDVRKCPRAGHA